MARTLVLKTQLSSRQDRHSDFEQHVKQFLLEQLGRFYQVLSILTEPYLAHSYLLLCLTQLKQLKVHSRLKNSGELACLLHLGKLGCRFLLFQAGYLSLSNSHFDHWYHLESRFQTQFRQLDLWYSCQQYLHRKHTDCAVSFYSAHLSQLRICLTICQPTPTVQKREQQKQHSSLHQESLQHAKKPLSQLRIGFQQPLIAYFTR